MSEFSDLQTTRGSEAYLRYCNGLWIAQDPAHSTELIGERDLNSNESKIEIIELVEDLLQSGSRDFLHESFPAGVTSFQDARNSRYVVEENARNLLEKTAEKEKDRLDAMNIAFWRLRPAPFLRGVTMTRLLHGDYEAIPTTVMLGDFAAHALLRETMQGRTLKTRGMGKTALGA